MTMVNEIIRYVEGFLGVNDSVSIKNLQERFNRSHSTNMDIIDFAIVISEQYVESNTNLKIVTANQENNIRFVTHKIEVSLKELSDKIQAQDTAQVCMIALTMVSKNQTVIPDDLEIRNCGKRSIPIDKRSNQIYNAITQILQ